MKDERSSPPAKPAWEVLLANDVIGCRECGKASSAINDPRAYGGGGHRKECSFKGQDSRPAMHYGFTGNFFYAVEGGAK